MLIGLVFYFILVVLALVSGSTQLWGLDSLIHISNPLKIILLILPIIFIFLIKNKSQETTINKFFKLVSQIPAIIWLVLFGILLFVFRQQGYFLGDGLLRIHDTELGLKFLPAEPLDTLIHSLTYKLLHSFFNFNAIGTYSLISIFSGVFALFFAGYFSKRLFEKKNERVLFILSIFTSGSILLFFGYVESYSIISSLIVIGTIYILVLIKEEKFTFVPILLFSLAVLFHPVCFIFFPSILFYYVLSSKNTGKNLIISLSFVSLVFIAVVIAGIGLILLSGANPKDIFTLVTDSHLKPLFSSSDQTGILSIVNLIDVVNELLLVSPLILLVPFILTDKQKLKEKIEIKTQDKNTFKFLLLAVIFPLLMILTFRSDLGFSRDWDLFSLIGFPLTILCFLIISKYIRNENYIIVTLLFIITLLTIPWILSNSEHQTALLRAEYQASNTNWNGHQKSSLYDEISHEYFNKNDLGKALIYSEKAYTYQKNDRINYSIGIILYKTGRLTEAFARFDELSKSNYKRGEVNTLKAELAYKLEKYDTAIESYNQILKSKKDNADLYFNLGMSWLKIGRQDSALRNLKLSAELNPSSIDVLITIGQIYSDAGKLDSVITYYNKLIKIDPRNANFDFAIALSYADMKQYRDAMKFAESAKTKGFEKNQVNQLIDELKNLLKQK